MDETVDTEFGLLIELDNIFWFNVLALEIVEVVRLNISLGTTNPGDILLIFKIGIGDGGVSEVGVWVRMGGEDTEIILLLIIFDEIEGDWMDEEYELLLVIVFILLILLILFKLLTLVFPILLEDHDY